MIWTQYASIACASGSWIEYRIRVAAGDLVRERWIHGNATGGIAGDGPEQTDIGSAGHVQIETCPLVGAPVLGRQGRAVLFDESTSTALVLFKPSTVLPFVAALPVMTLIR